MGALLGASKSKDSNSKPFIYPKNGFPVAEHRLDPIARVLLMGVYDDSNKLSIFRGMRYIIKEIWTLTIQFNKQHYIPFMQILNHDNYYYDHADNYSPGMLKADHPSGCQYNYDSRNLQFFNQRTDFRNLQFPKPLSFKTEIHINMMPIEMIPDEKKLKSQLPNDVQRYLKFIIACFQADPSQNGKICYLTVHESFVGKGKTQRRPGLHIEAPGNGTGTARMVYAWGDGYNGQDGLFIASNISNSCAIWDCRIIERDSTEVIGKLGNIEHIRACLPANKKTQVEAHRLYWLTDRTPHEALPMKESGYRQFFRLVSSKLSVWYSQHSTANPKGTTPDKSITKINNNNKFLS